MNMYYFWSQKRKELKEKQREGRERERGKRREREAVKTILSLEMMPFHWDFPRMEHSLPGVTISGWM